MMHLQDLTVWDYLSVEVAVKIKERLEGDENDPDATSTVYEFINEAIEAVSWYVDNFDVTVAEISNKFVETFERSLGHKYSAETFDQISNFIIKRKLSFENQSLV